MNFLGGGPDLALVDPLGEPEGVEGLVDVVLPRRKVDEHQCLAVPAEAVHQEVGQLGIAVGDVAVLEKEDKKLQVILLSREEFFRVNKNDITCYCKLEVLGVVHNRKTYFSEA